MAEADLDGLLYRAGRGDERAFRALYDAAAPKLMAIALRLLKDHQQAEDVVQHTMIAAWHSATDYDPERAKATTWLTSIARYRALDLLRTSGRQARLLKRDKEAVLAALGQDEPFDPGDPIPSQTMSRLERCLGQISREQAGCIQLAFLDGLTFAEIAAQLERSIGTVKSWIRRGLGALRECVER